MIRCTGPLSGGLGSQLIASRSQKPRADPSHEACCESGRRSWKSEPPLSLVWQECPMDVADSLADMRGLHYSLMGTLRSMWDMKS